MSNLGRLFYSYQRRATAVALAMLVTLNVMASVSFLSLNTQISLCNNFLSTEDLSQYPAVSIIELRDYIELMEAQKLDPNITQTQINSYRDALQLKLAEVRGLKGFKLNDSMVLPDGYETNRGFIHPGALHTQADFERIKQQLADGDSFVTAAYQMLTSNGYSSSAAYVGPVDTIRRGGGGWQNYIFASRAAHIAYMNGLMWKITGNTSYARNAIRHLNEWAKVCKFITGDSNQALAAGLTGYEFANAGELLRDFSEWTPEDFKAFQRWLLDVWYPANNGFLRYRAGTWENVGKWWQAPGHYWSNWGLCNALSMISIGVVCDDPFIYNQGVSYFKYQHVKTDDAWPNNYRDGILYDQGLNEFIAMLVPYPVDDARGPLGKLGQMEESGRDQGHAQLALGLAVDLCQTVFNQGDDAFAVMDDRLAAGIEWQMAYNTQDTTMIKTLPWTPFKYATNGIAFSDYRSWLQTGPSDAARGTIRPYVERILGYYEGYRGVKMKYTEIARSIIGMEGGGGGSVSGGYDHLGLTSLTCHKPVVDSTKAPTVLKTRISYLGKTLDQCETGNLDDTYAMDTCKSVPAGTVVQLLPELPAGESNTGQWQWSTGETSQNLTITANRSMLYRVTYTNSRGAKSTAAYSIAVKGDCQPDGLRPFITYNGTTVNDTTITVLAYSDVTLKATSYSDWGSMQWSNGSKANTIQVKNIGQDREYSVVYTNQGEAQTKLTFHIHVVGMTPSLRVDSAEVQSTDSVLVMKGQRLVLIPQANEAYKVGDWAWSDGSTADTLAIDSVTSSGVYTVVHTLGNHKDSLTFRVLCASPDFGPADGNYYLLDLSTDKYLTNVGLTVPRFSDQTDAGDPGQQWMIVMDGDRYKIVSRKDDKYLNYNARLALSSNYTADKNTYYIYGLNGTDTYAIQGVTAVGGEFWTISATSTLDTHGSTVLTTFPFRLLPVGEAAGIEGLSAAPVEVTLYSLDGQIVTQTRLNAPADISSLGLRKGIYLLRMVQGTRATTRKIIIK